MSVLGMRIQAARKKAGLTQKELAAQIGLATGTVQQYELGKRTPKLEVLQNIADALEISLTDLFPTSRDVVAENTSALSKAHLAQAEKALTTGKVTSTSEYLKTDESLKFSNQVKEQLGDSFLLGCYAKLNKKGQQIALERIAELTKIPDYQKGYEEPPSQNQEGTDESSSGEDKTS